MYHETHIFMFGLKNVKLILLIHVVNFKTNIFYTFSNSVDPNEMQHHAAFHLGLHCLQKYLF